MKRFHVHVAVGDLAANIDFYTKLFGEPPTKQRDDYAKWMLDDPRLNFAVSLRSAGAGLNHFGMQAETAEELAGLRALAAAAAQGALRNEGSTSCCYAQSDKHWTVDPQGLAWEHFLTTGEATELATRRVDASTGCCIPLRDTAETTTAAKAACCLPADAAAARCCV